MAGLWCTSLGYSNQELVETATEQMKKLPFTHIFGGRSHDPAIELAEKLKEIAPVPISKVFYGASGSDANDTQVKIVWYMNNALGRPQKKKIISRLKGYHGVTVASASLTGLPNNHIDFDLPLPGILHTSCPHHYRFAEPGESEQDFSSRLAAELEEMILREGPDTVAAFIAEPVMGAGGAITPPEGYFEKINAVLAKYDILFIADEVITGFGRTGNMFGTTTYGMKADTISLAKQITSAYFPLSAVMMNEAVYEVLVDQSRKIGTFGHGNTYAGHPVGCAIAVKTLEIYQRDKIVEHVRKVAPTFLQAPGEALASIRSSARPRRRPDRRRRTRQGQGDQGPVRGQEGRRRQIGGLRAGRGLITRAMGDRVAFCPPLIINEAEIEEMFDRYERALDKTLNWVKAEGLLAA
jgi:4-aminobutyrate--pyruvate transaminase